MTKSELTKIAETFLLAALEAGFDNTAGVCMEYKDCKYLLLISKELDSTKIDCIEELQNRVKELEAQLCR